MSFAELIAAQKRTSFAVPAMATDEEAAGIVIARHFKWDGAAILRVAEAALEDANFHAEAQKLSELRERV